MTRLNGLLLLLSLFFGLAVVFLQQKHHVLYNVLEVEVQISKKLDREYMVLQLEESQIRSLILIKKKASLIWICTHLLLLKRNLFFWVNDYEGLSI